MGPKKQAKGGGGDGEKDAATLDLENKMLEKRLQVLQYRLSTYSCHKVLKKSLL